MTPRATARTPLRLAVVGVGTIARFYLEALERLESVELAAVCDAKTERLRPWEGKAATFGDHRELVRQDLDGIVVCVPNHVHAAVARDALAAGLHVCLEKPLANDLADGRDLVRLAGEQERVLHTAFHRRYNLHILRLAQELEARRDAGCRPRRFAARYLEDIREHVGVDPWYLDPAQCGGGCIADNGPNVFDTLSFLAGHLMLTGCRAYTDPAGLDMQAWIELETRRGAPVQVELDWAYPHGEAKDVTVWMEDGSTLRADMLAGFEGFKSSLAHEYEAILLDFERSVRRGPGAGEMDPGLAALELVHRAYELAGMARSGSAPAHEPAGEEPVLKGPVAGRLIKLLTHAQSDRGMTLIEAQSRCVARGEIHELVTTDQRQLAAGDRVDRVGFIGFAEITEPGVVERGDVLEIEGESVGTVVGFDDCHFPNHYNILVERHALATGATLGHPLHRRVRFVGRGRSVPHASTAEAARRPATV